jgi:hypothetical protein
MAFREKMKKYHAAMENALYAAEQLCDNEWSEGENTCDTCPFAGNEDHPFPRCGVSASRLIIGDHIIQHDCMVPPCQCAGDTGKTQPE